MTLVSPTDSDPGRSFIIRRRDGSEWTVLVSDSDYESVLNAGPWFVTLVRKERPYVVRNARGVDGVRRTERLHEFLLGAKGVDHASNDSLDNRRSNLRRATGSENQYNRAVSRRSKSGRKGVVWQPSCKRWQAAIRADGECIYLGVFKDIEDAAMAYEGASLLLHGEFSRVR